MFRPVEQLVIKPLKREGYEEIDTFRYVPTIVVPDKTWVKPLLQQGSWDVMDSVAGVRSYASRTMLFNGERYWNFTYHEDIPNRIETAVIQALAWGCSQIATISPYLGLQNGCPIVVSDVVESYSDNFELRLDETHADDLKFANRFHPIMMPELMKIAGNIPSVRSVPILNRKIIYNRPHDLHSDSATGNLEWMKQMYPGKFDDCYSGVIGIDASQELKQDIKTTLMLELTRALDLAMQSNE